MKKIPSSGPSNAQVLIVGESPNRKDADNNLPFVGPGGVELTKMLQQVGFLRAECFLTYAVPYYLPDKKLTQLFYTKTAGKKDPEAKFILNRFVHPLVADGVTDLEDLITQLQPKIIIALGNAALWALTGEWGIMKWRGSNLETREISLQRFPLLPTYNPDSILSNWDRRYITVHDLRQAGRILNDGLPTVEENITIRPSFDDTIRYLNLLLTKADNISSGKLDLAVDIETRFRQITCVGIAHSAVDAICIPFLEIKAQDRNYWQTLDEEVEIVWLLRKLLTHKNVKIIGQNFPYDQQYFARRMGFIPNYKPDNFHDTMTAHHVMFPGLPKGLDFISSLYAQETHKYWKDEGKEWNPKEHDEERHWLYNGKDALRTYIVAQEQVKTYESLNFKRTTYGDPWTIQHMVHEPILKAMLRGVCIDNEKKQAFWKSLGEVITRLEEYINFLLGHPLNPRSPQQLQKLFYNDFKVKPVTTYDRATGKRRRTTNADALHTIGQREILLAPVCNAIIDVRGLGTAKSVAAQELDIDRRMRCSYSVPGTETYRFNSREDAFGYGTNLQNISSGNESHPSDSPLYRPNLRKMFVPDPDHVICDHDLEQADARIVACESDCKSLKEIFNDPDRDLHNENTEIIFGKFTPELRPKAKAGVHATNYGATPPVLAAALGITNHEADIFIRRYFDERPEVKVWHNRVLHDLQTRRYVENIFGYRRFYFDRIENLLKEALAWIPQSTVAIAVNLGILQVKERCPWAEFLLQVHDSAVHQFPLRYANDARAYNTEEIKHDFEAIRSAMEVVLPYDDPMTIPVSGEWSTESWWHCK